MCILNLSTQNAQYVRKSDWLICEAFCLESDAEKYNPREKYHSTVIDASTNAQELGVSHLIFYHTEEDTIATRKQTYMQEAAQVFDGKVFVPEDLESISLD